MKIQDSGNRESFDSGAVRDMQKGKGRCDLLPLEEIGLVYSDDILKSIGMFIITGYFIHLEKAILEFTTGKIHSSLLELSKYYEQGLEKYGERNWEKGIPVSSFINSAVRHYLKDMDGQKDENHEMAFLWNMFGALWTLNNRPEFNDIPHLAHENGREKINEEAPAEGGEAEEVGEPLVLSDFKVGDKVVFNSDVPSLGISMGTCAFVAKKTSKSLYLIVSNPDSPNEHQTRFISSIFFKHLSFLEEG